MWNPMMKRELEQAKNEIKAILEVSSEHLREHENRIKRAERTLDFLGTESWINLCLFVILFVTAFYLLTKTRHLL